MNKLIFCNFPFHLQSVSIHSTVGVESCTKTCRRVLISALLYLTGAESFCDLGECGVNFVFVLPVYAAAF
jgi:hypothetical protein